MIELNAPTRPVIAANDNDLSWFIARVAPMAERRLIFSLKDLGITAYLPCEVKWKRHRRKDKERMKFPLFVGYAFIGLEVDEHGAPERLHELRANVGVLGLVGINGQPVQIATTEVARILKQEEDGEFDHTPIEKIPFKVGQTVKIIRGQFAGVIVTIEEAAANDRVKVAGKAIFAKGSWMVDVDHIEAA